MIYFYFPKKLDSVLCPIQLPFYRISSLGVKRQWREADHSLPSADEIKHRPTFQSLQTFMASSETNTHLRDFRLSPLRIWDGRCIPTCGDSLSVSSSR